MSTRQVSVAMIAEHVGQQPAAVRQALKAEKIQVKRLPEASGCAATVNPAFHGMLQCFPSGARSTLLCSISGMTPRPITWNELAHVLSMIAVVLRDDGRTPIPPHDETPSPELDARCDEWCRMFAKDIRDIQLPLVELRSWILARVISVQVVAKHLDEKGEPSPGLLSRELMEQLLINEWHGELRDRWMLLMDLPNVDG